MKESGSSEWQVLLVPSGCLWLGAERCLVSKHSLVRLRHLFLDLPQRNAPPWRLTCATGLQEPCATALVGGLERLWLLRLSRILQAICLRLVVRPLLILETLEQGLGRDICRRGDTFSLRAWLRNSRSRVMCFT